MHASKEYHRLVICEIQYVDLGGTGDPVAILAGVDGLVPPGKHVLRHIEHLNALPVSKMPGEAAAPVAPAQSSGMQPTRASVSHTSVKSLLAQGPQGFHSYVADHFQRASDSPLPQLSVRVKNLSLTVDVAVAHKAAPDSSATSELPTLPTVFMKSVRGAIPSFPFSSSKPRRAILTKHILREITGSFEPGTTTLILGQPGSGKSSLLQLLSGRFPTEDKRVSISGEIEYNDQPQEELKCRLPQFVSYVTQLDTHLATLTVEETLAFAHKCSSAHFARHVEGLLGHSEDPAVNKAAQEIARVLLEHLPTVVIQQLGLQDCARTVIGDGMLRGVSGGERKRVTTGEMIMGMPLTLMLDSISTGLDSAATFDIISTMRSLAKEFRKTVVIALLQPSPEVFSLFDNVLLLNDGRVVYHGPVAKVAGYFQTLGFVCPKERDFADFLLDLGTEEQIKYQVDVQSGRPTEGNQQLAHPRTAEEFAAAFTSSHIFEQSQRNVNAPIDTATLQSTHTYIDTIPEFQEGFLSSTWSLVRREALVLSRNSAFLIGRTFMTVVMGLLYASTFYQFDPANVQVVMGVIFSATFFVSLGQASQIPTLMEVRKVFYKQRRANFFRSSSFVFANSVSRIPAALLETIVFGCLIYWMCGFTATAKEFILYELILLLTSIMFGAWYFLLVTISPNTFVAMPLAMLSVLFYVMFAGFVIPRAQIPDYLIWLYWISPMAWCVRALSVNQFRAPDFDVCVYGGVDYCATTGARSMGEYYLSLFDVPSSKYWVPGGLLFMAFSYVVFLLISTWALEYHRFEAPEDSAVTTDIHSTHELSAPESGQRNGDVILAIDRDEANPSSGYHLVKSPSNRQKADHTLDENKVDDQPHQRPGFVPVTLAFQDLWYSVPAPAKKKSEMLDLLKGVSGYARPGYMTALMGSSGAGKTTLMDVIAHRKTGGRVRGKILLNGYEATDLVMRRSTGYCEQSDVHCEAATFREALTFSAFLRQESDVPNNQKLASVEECLDLLDLRPIADKIIRGSSMEQLKRLTIGVELAAQPSVLFLDEPTSGLDAFSAKAIMDGVQNVARSGRTVMTTIHQPSAEVFALFDSVLLLKRGGETVFFGDVGPNCRTLVDYFERIPGVSPLPPACNPATWMLECIGAGVNHVSLSDTESADHRSVDFVDTFKNSELQASLNTVLRLSGVSTPSEEVPELRFSMKRAASGATQFKFLLQRSFATYWRTASYNLTRLIISIVLALFFGIVFVNADYSTYQGINAGIGMLFLVTGFNGIVSFFSVLPVAAADRGAFYRERAAQTYNALWYFVATTLVEVPYVLVSALLFTAIFYPMVGFTGFTSGVLYWITTALLILLQTYTGQLLSYALPSEEVAMVLGVLLNTMSFLFMGFNPPVIAIPAGYNWVYQINPQRYSFNVLAAVVFADCADPAGGSALGCQPLLGAPVTVNYANVKEYVEDVFGASHDRLWRNFGVTVAMVGVLRVLALLALRFVNHQKR